MDDGDLGRSLTRSHWVAFRRWIEAHERGVFRLIANPAGIRHRQLEQGVGARHFASRVGHPIETEAGPDGPTVHPPVPAAR